MSVPQRATWAQRWRDFWSPPDQILVDAGAQGELVVARIRMVVASILVVIPVSQVVTDPGGRDVSASLLIAIGAAVLAAIIYLVVRNRIYHPLLGFVTSVVDVTLVSAVLVTYLAVDQPLLAVNSRVVYPIYFLAIGATALRYDARTCALTGLIAVGQYSAIVSYADMHWILNDPSVAPFEYGMFSWNIQFARMLLMGCAGLVSTAITLRTEHLRWLSASDPLTKLMNRGFFDERIAEEGIRARRYRRALSIAMADLDGFKAFNDTYGHAAGDTALRMVAEAIRTTVRRTDLVARYGGEEFVVAFPETFATAAYHKVEEIRVAIEKLEIPVRGNRTARITVSLGLAGWPIDGETIRDVIERADERLYQAKQAGRNRATGPQPTIPDHFLKTAS